MKEEIEVIDGEEYTMTTLDSGTIIKELRMTEAQKAILAQRTSERIDPLESIKTTLEKLAADITAIKAQTQPATK